MKAKDIVVGGVYVAKITAKLTHVKVEAIRETRRFAGRDYAGNPRYKDALVYDVVNLSTGRRTMFRTAVKFRSQVMEEAK